MAILRRSTRYPPDQQLLSPQRRQVLKVVIAVGVVVCAEPARAASRLVLFLDYPLKPGVGLVPTVSCCG